jgi:hypothetical protein
MKARPYQLARWIVRIFLASAITALLLVGWDLATFNFGTVQRGRIYRSGQMPPSALARTIHDYRIRTILNLRGPNKDAWYLAEREATLGARAIQVDIPMSSCIWMSHAQLRTVVKTLDTAEYPLLIHCQWGAERTGLVSAFAELLRPGSTLEDARSQLSIRYLFLRLNDGRIMAEHLDQYEQWLAAEGRKHTPEQFRRWVQDGFQPRTPSREQWPYDPYPLVVISHPIAGAAPGAIAPSVDRTKP